MRMDENSSAGIGWKKKGAIAIAPPVQFPNKTRLGAQIKSFEFAAQTRPSQILTKRRRSVRANNRGDPINATGTRLSATRLGQRD